MSQHTGWLRVHDEWMGAGGHSSVSNLDENTVALIVILTVTV